MNSEAIIRMPYLKFRDGGKKIRIPEVKPKNGRARNEKCVKAQQIVFDAGYLIAYRDGSLAESVVVFDWELARRMASSTGGKVISRKWYERRNGIRIEEDPEGAEEND